MDVVGRQTGSFQELSAPREIVNSPFMETFKEKLDGFVSVEEDDKFQAGDSRPNALPAWRMHDSTTLRALESQTASPCPVLNTTWDLDSKAVGWIPAQLLPFSQNLHIAGEPPTIFPWGRMDAHLVGCPPAKASCLNFYTNDPALPWKSPESGSKQRLLQK